MRHISPRRRHRPATRKITLLAAITVLAAGSALAAHWIPGGGETDEVKALRVLRTDRATLDRQLAALSTTSRLAEMRRWGRGARADAVRLHAESGLEGLEDPAVAEPARTAHQAITDILTGFGAVATIDEHNLDEWDAGERQATFAASTLDAERPAIGALDDVHPLRLDVGGTDVALKRISTRLTTIGRRLVVHERRLANARRDRRVALDHALAYVDDVSGAVAAAQAGDGGAGIESSGTLDALHVPTWARRDHNRLAAALRASHARPARPAQQSSADDPASASSVGTGGISSASPTAPAAPRADEAAPEEEALESALAGWTATVATHLRLLRDAAPIA
jgi:hypothetical protein